MRVGWLGLGAMGAPMAGGVARAGHAVTAYDIAAGRAAALGGDGVRAADSIAGAVRDAGIVVIMVATPDQVDEVLFGPGGAAGALTPGTVVMIMATVGPEAVAQAAASAAPAGAAARATPAAPGSWWRRAGVRRRAACGHGDLLIMVSGADDAVGRARPAARRAGRAAPPWSARPPAMASG